MPWNTPPVFAPRCLSYIRLVNPLDETTSFSASEIDDIVEEHLSCYHSDLPRILDILYASCTRQRRPYEP